MAHDYKHNSDKLNEQVAHLEERKSASADRITASTPSVATITTRKE